MLCLVAEGWPEKQHPFQPWDWLGQQRCPQAAEELDCCVRGASTASTAHHQSRVARNTRAEQPCREFPPV